MNQELIKQYQPPEWRIEKHKLKKCFYKACWFVCSLICWEPLLPMLQQQFEVQGPAQWPNPGLNQKKGSKLLGSSRLNFWHIDIEESICLIAWWTRTCPWFDFIHSYALRMCLRDATTVQPEVFHGTRLSCLYLRQSFGKVDFQPSL